MLAYWALEKCSAKQFPMKKLPRGAIALFGCAISAHATIEDRDEARTAKMAAAQQ
jgi:hypothetical protein